MDVGGEGLGVWTVSSCAGEWDCLGRKDIVCVEDVDDFGEDGGSLPESGDEDQGWFDHLGMEALGSCRK